MHPVHDVDALLLLSLALASKRRPAKLAEIIAAADLIHGAIPSAAKLADAFRRLTSHGLVDAGEQRFSLTPAAQRIIAAQPKKADAAERVFGIKESLSGHEPDTVLPAIVPDEDEFDAAVAAHRAAAAGAGKNMLMPKPKPAEIDKRRAAQWRRPGPPRGRRA